MSFTKFPLCLLLSLWMFKAIFAFQTTSLNLTVIDQNSAVISNVTTRLKKQNVLVKEVKISESKTITFSSIEADEYLLEIEAVGFKPFSEEIEIKLGNNQKTVNLQIAEVSENVVVDQSQQDKNLDIRNGTFTNFLTKAEIEALPDDPELLKKALQQKFGEDAEFFVDGFSSGGLPPKSQIASIKVSQTSFDAEYHTLGISYIEITTKPGFDKWIRLISFNFNDESLNSRNPFATSRQPAQIRDFDILLLGPIKNEKTSLVVNVYGGNSYETSNIIAVLPTGRVENSLKSPSNNFSVSGRISHILSQYQTINSSYTFNKRTSGNIGIGGFNLLERAFDLNSQSHQFRFSQSGNVGESFFNEFRLEYLNEKSKTISTSKDTAIIVLDAFSKGGAGNDSDNHKQSVSLADNLLFGIKNHALKIGGIIVYEQQKLLSSENQNGTFLFSSLNDFQLGKPSIFTRKPDEQKVNISQVRLGGFIQDDIRLHKSFMLSLGLRYEWQNNLKDYNNFSPRLGFVWSPKQNSKTTFRGGAGIFYNWFESNTLATVLSRDINRRSETVITNPGFPNPFLGGTSQILAKSYWQKADDLRNPYIFLTQIGVERQLSEKSSIRVQYSYQKGIHQFRSRDLNAPINFTRPDGNFGRIIQLESSAFFVRNSLKIGFNTTPSKTTFLSIDYRLAKSISDADGYFSLPSDNYNLRLDHSASSNDQRHRFYGSFGWSLPQGFRFSTIFYANSPTPYTITTGKDENGDTIFNDRPNGVFRNSERARWQKQSDISFSWRFSFDKGERKFASSNSNLELISGRALKLELRAENIFNQTNFQTFVGVQTSPFFRQPISASNPRKISLGIRFNF